MPAVPIKNKTALSKPQSHGALWDIGHLISGTSKGLYHGVTGLPTGAYMTARALGHDIASVPRHNPAGVFDPTNYLASAVQGRTGQIGKNVAKQEYNSYRHFGKGGDVSGPLLDALAAVTGGTSLAARTGKTVSEVSKAAKAARAAHAADLVMKDTAVMQAVGSSGVKGVGYDRAAGMYKIPADTLKKHYRAHRLGLQEGNMSVGKKGGAFANVPPAKVLKNPSHPLYDFYAQRNPNPPTKFQAGVKTSTRAKKAFMQKPLYSRPILKGGIGDKTRSGFYVPTSPNPLFRGTRAGIEQLRTKENAARELRKEAVRREITQERFGAAKNIRKTPPKAPEKAGALQAALSSPMAALRTAMWLRPRYYLQNAAQTGQMLATSPVLTGKSMRLASDLFRNNRPLYNTARAVTGETQAGALAAGTSPSKLGAAVGKRIGGRLGQQFEQRGIQGAMGYAANIPESHIRMLSVLNELQKHHAARGNLSALTPAHVQQYFDNIRRSGVISPEHLPLRRAVEEVGDFGRIFSKSMLKQKRPSEREFMQTQIPIFYPMFKALSRYGARFPSEHAVMTAQGTALGKQGKIEQQRLLGKLPYWGQYLIPKSAGDPNAVKQPLVATRNPGSIYNFQPGADIARQVAEMGRMGGPNPGVSVLQESGPAPGLIYGSVTGKDIQTGYPIRPFSKTTYQRHPELNRAPSNTILDYFKHLPLADLERLATGQTPPVRSYLPGSTKDRIFQELFGPALIPRTLKTKETTKQAKRESNFGKPKPPKKPKSYGG